MSALAFIGQDPRISKVLEIVGRVADTDATVLITGETGTGKELIAQALHDQSSRRKNAFIAVNCGAIPETLLESELFGHMRGAFTSATQSRLGRFEAAHEGTIFLDEISDMSHSLQVKLLRVLQTGEYTPVGSSNSRHCSVRVVAASNKALRPLVDSGQIRADLYYRLNVICVDLPPLRDRPGDILPLARHFLGQMGKNRLRLTEEAEEVLLRHSYPGNVRELENAMRRASIMCQGDEIRVRDLPPEVHCKLGGSESHPRRFHAAKAQVVNDFERAYLLDLLRDCGGIVSRAARQAGLSERNLHVKMRKYGLRGRDFRTVPDPVTSEH